MLTTNIDVCDSLANGALGTVVGFLRNSSNEVDTVFVCFNNEKIGRNLRRKNSIALQRRFPDGIVTPIRKIEQKFGRSNNPTSNKELGTATQFPLKLAFCISSHKMQGKNVINPSKLNADLQTVREPAQAYVILSRVQTLKQLFIIDKLPRKNLYA